VNVAGKLGSSESTSAVERAAPGGAARLCWADIDLDDGRLHVRRQLGRDCTLRDLKTPAARRSLPLPRHVVDVLRAHRAAQVAEQVAAIYWEDQAERVPLDLMYDRVATSSGRGA
jgi:integrase